VLGPDDEGAALAVDADRLAAVGDVDVGLARGVGGDDAKLERAGARATVAAREVAVVTALFGGHGAGLAVTVAAAARLADTGDADVGFELAAGRAVRDGREHAGALLGGLR